MPSFYKFLYWAPFIHNVEVRPGPSPLSSSLTPADLFFFHFQAYKIIAFGTDLTHRIGYHFGIIFALIGVEVIGFPLSVFFERWKLDRGKMRAKAKEEEEKGKDREKNQQRGNGEA